MTAEITKWAIGYATALGWPMLPARPALKRPYIPSGRDHAENASRDPDQIRYWFEVEFPRAALAMPCGAASGVVVIDADTKHDGERLLAQLETEFGPLPRTHVVQTQNGGIHVYLAHPGSHVRVKSVDGKGAGWGPGVDIRADGGIVLLPPSLGYRWEIDSAPELAPIPERWLARLGAAPTKPAPVPVEIPPAPPAYSGDLEPCVETLREWRYRYRRSKRDGDAGRADLLDRIIHGRALAECGARDSSVHLAGSIIGWALPDIGPDAAEFLAIESLVRIPVPHGDREDVAFWRAKFRQSYELAAERWRAERERNRLMWLRVAESFAGGRHA